MACKSYVWSLIARRQAQSQVWVSSARLVPLAGPLADLIGLGLADSAEWAEWARWAGPFGWAEWTWAERNEVVLTCLAGFFASAQRSEEVWLRQYRYDL